jgi:hypothetical protein
LTANDFENTANAVGKQFSFTERIGRTDPKAVVNEAGEALAGTGAYKAFGYMPSGIAETCDIQGWLENSETAHGVEVPFRYIMQIGYVGEEQIKLFLPDCIIVIEGAYLRELRKMLARRQCTFIQQFSQRVWRDPPPKGEAIIEKIAIVRPQPIEDAKRNW